MRLLMTIIAVLLLTACLNVQLAIQVASPFAPDPTPTPEIAYTIVGTVRAKNALLNVRGCRIVNDAVCPVVMVLRGADTLPVVDMVNPDYPDTDPEWWYVAISGDVAYAWVSKFASVYEGVR